MLKRTPRDARQEARVGIGQLQKSIAPSRASDDLLHSLPVHVCIVFYAICAWFATALVSVIEEVLARMAALNVSQSVLARECGLSQPHLSRVLNKQLKLATKTRTKLEAWLANSDFSSGPDAAAIPIRKDLERLVERLSSSSPDRRMQIMHLLHAIEAIVIES